MGRIDNDRPEFSLRPLVGPGALFVLFCFLHKNRDLTRRLFPMLLLLLSQLLNLFPGDLMRLELCVTPYGVFQMQPPMLCAKRYCQAPGPRRKCFFRFFPPFRSSSMREVHERDAQWLTALSLEQIE
jgi:hypothetical protein